MRVLGLQLYSRHSPLGLRFLSLKMGRSASALPTLVGRGHVLYPQEGLARGEGPAVVERPSSLGRSCEQSSFCSSSRPAAGGPLLPAAFFGG